MKIELMVVMLALAAVACTEAQPAPVSATSMKTAAPPPACPLGVSGARVAYEDTESGGRLTLTAPPAQLDDLRRRARDAAAMHGPARQGEGHEGRHAMGGEHGLRPMQLPPSRGEAQDLEGGARIDLTPYDAADLTVLRAKLRDRAHEMMASCE
jgi:hypothetical protein